MKILITICARGGSKGIPGKNIKNLDGKPLIFYTIEVAKQFKSMVNDVEIVISSDSEEIIKVSNSFGLKTEYIRPKRLAGDDIGKIDTIKDVLSYKENMNGYRFDYILDLDVTSPLRNLKDLTNAFEMFVNDNDCLTLFSVSQASRNPYFNMVEEKNNRFYAQVKEPKDQILTRQSAPKVFDMNASFYFYKRLFFDKSYVGPITDKSKIYLIPHICFDLDDIIDFEFLSFLIKNKKLDFEL